MSALWQSLSHHSGMCTNFSLAATVAMLAITLAHALAVLFGKDVTVVTTRQKLDTTRKKLTKRFTA